MMRGGILALLAAAALAGQAPPAPPPTAAPSALRYEGKPLAVPFRCSDDDIAWAGLSCSEDEPCPVYLELSAVEGAGNSLFVIGNLHSESVTMYSILLASDDSGRTWHEAHERNRGAGLDRIQFSDFESGWISGQTLFPLPQDPFLLITSDGGKSWRQRPLFPEGRPGSILQFWFSSKTDGSLVVDRGQGGEGGRYELYESPNGGETWMVRESSDRPIALKRGPLAAPPWRLRADGPTKSFRIERQGPGERWTAVAAFAIAAGACVPSPAKEAAPPSEESPDASAPAVQELRLPPSGPPSRKRPPKP